MGGALGGGAIGVGPREGGVEEVDLGPNLGDERVVGPRGGRGAAGGEGRGGVVVPIVVLLVLVLDHLELALLALALRRGVVAEVVVRPLLLHGRGAKVLWRRWGRERRMGEGYAVLGQLREGTGAARGGVGGLGVCLFFIFIFQKQEGLEAGFGKI